MCRPAIAVVVLLLGSLGAAGAQGRDVRRVESPFQGEFDYRIGEELRPRVEVDGVLWTRFAVRTRDGRDIDLDKPNPVLVEFDIVAEGEPADVQLIVLFEDEHGNPLERLACDPVDTGRGRLKNVVEKHKLPGIALQATRKVYLYFEVTR